MIKMIDFELDISSEQSLEGCIRDISYAVMLSRRPEQFYHDQFELIELQNRMTGLADFAIMFLRMMMGSLADDHTPLIIQTREDMRDKIIRSVDELNRRIAILDKMHEQSMKTGKAHEA